jgi:hypothetical protein
MPFLLKRDPFFHSFDKRTQRVIQDVYLSINQNNASALYENLNTWLQLIQEEGEEGEWESYLHVFLIALMKKNKFPILETLLIQGLSMNQDTKYPLIWDYCLDSPFLAMLFSEIFYLNLMAYLPRRYQVVQALVLKNNPGIRGVAEFSKLDQEGQWVSLNDLCRRPNIRLPLATVTWYVLKNYSVEPEFCKQLLGFCQHASDYPVYYYTIIRYVLTQIPEPSEGDPTLTILKNIFLLWGNDYQTNFIEPRIAFTHWALSALSQNPNPIAQVFSCILLFSDVHLAKTSELELHAITTTRRKLWSLKSILWLKDSGLGKTVLTMKALITDTVDELNEVYEHACYKKIQELSESDLRYFPKEIEIFSNVERADKVVLAQWIDMKRSIEMLFSSALHQLWLKKLCPDFPMDKMQLEFSNILAKQLHWLVVLNASHTERVSYLFEKLKSFVTKCEVIHEQLNQLREIGFIVCEEADHYYQEITRKIYPALHEMEAALKDHRIPPSRQEQTLKRFKKILLDIFVDDYVKLKAWFYQAKNLAQQLGSAAQLADNLTLYRWQYGLVDQQQDEGGMNGVDYTVLYLPKFQSMIKPASPIEVFSQKMESLPCTLYLKK